MVGLILQDMIDAWAKMNKEKFCKHVPMPLLIAKQTFEDPVFQSEATRFGMDRAKLLSDNRFHLSHRLVVMEVGQASTGVESQISVGRAEENDVVISDETVSAQHAVFIKDSESGSWLVEDLGSTNGTQLNGTPLTPNELAELNDGDMLSFGDSEFLFFTPAGLYEELTEWLKNEDPE